MDQEGQAESLMKEINLMSSITGSEALEELTNHTKRLKDCIVETRELIRQKKEQWEKSFLQTMKGLRNCILHCVIATIKQCESGKSDLSFVHCPIGSLQKSLSHLRNGCRMSSSL